MFKPFPILFPINLIGEITNPLSQALRLFGNMMSGVVIMGLWYGMMPIFVKNWVSRHFYMYIVTYSRAVYRHMYSVC